MLPANNEDEAYTECEDDLNRACADLANCAGDTGILLSQLSDNGIYFETKAAYGKDVVTAFIQLNGATVGAVANRSEIYGEDGTVKEKMDGTLSARGAKKAADFVNFCDAFCIPVLTITNVTGFKATKCSERTMAKNAAALTAAFANATVPKVNVVVGKAYGSAYVVMNSKSIGADMVFAWPNAEIGMMDAKSAAKIMYEGSDAATINEKAEQCNFRSQKRLCGHHHRAGRHQKICYRRIRDAVYQERRQTGQKTRNSLRKVAYDEKELEKISKSRPYRSLHHGCDRSSCFCGCGIYTGLFTG